VRQGRHAQSTPDCAKRSLDVRRFALPLPGLRLGRTHSMSQPLCATATMQHRAATRAQISPGAAHRGPSNAAPSCHPAPAVRRCVDGAPLPVLTTPGGKHYVISEEGCEYEVELQTGPTFPLVHHPTVLRVSAALCRPRPQATLHGDDSKLAALRHGHGLLSGGPRCHAQCTVEKATGTSDAATAPACMCELRLIRHGPLLVPVQASLYVDGQPVGYNYPKLKPNSSYVYEGFCISGGGACSQPVCTMFVGCSGRVRAVPRVDICVLLW
jgi:hypothetical protein